MGNVISCIFGWNGLDRASLGILGAGQRLAKELDAKHFVLLVGASAAIDPLADFADSVHIADDPLLAKYHSETTLTALAQACGFLEPHTVLLGNDTYSQELAPRLAHRLGGSAAADALALQVKDGTILATRPVYGGKAQAVVALRRAPAVIWLRARAQAPAQRQTQRATINKVSLSLKVDERVRLVSQKMGADNGTVRLEDARFIVSGGRGMGGPEPFKLLQELAKVMGAEMAASRAACDAGWVPPTWQVGQTGKKVAPELYLAIALSGASQHLMGIADAKVIAAINTDPDAPIFGHCRFGLVEDYRNVVGLLQKKLAELRAGDTP
jgi:electron transfer flavoprotein alpha subunit